MDILPTLEANDTRTLNEGMKESTDLTDRNTDRAQPLLVLTIPSQ